MPLPYRPPLEEDMTFDREGMGRKMLQMAAESNRYFVGSDIAKNSPEAVPGLYIGQALQDIAKLGYFHGPAPVRKLSQKLSALAFGPDEAFNDKTTSRPSLGQYKGLHEGVKRGLTQRVSDGVIDQLAPRIAKLQNAPVAQVKGYLQKERDYALDAYQPSLTERLQDFTQLMSGDLRQARTDQERLRQAGLTEPKEQTPSGNIWGLTHPVEARKLLVDQLKHLNPGAKVPEVVPSNLRLR